VRLLLHGPFFGNALQFRIRSRQFLPEPGALCTHGIEFALFHPPHESHSAPIFLVIDRLMYRR
ncbi:MAG: hypothetical protein KA451_13160, partial [Methyloversatilis sp.]|nr:hypothetical protein [Methyloversatilis sp.]